ncbi:MAG TPA: SAM hydroxide adenosyltransferase, partial [Anaerolineales bacterium]|nr:SAM hydroxide adenosyltransferase [Anaerolineales bacterium]
GVPLPKLGTPFIDPVRLELPKPEKTNDGWHGEVTLIDHFGNIGSNIRVENLGPAMENKENIMVRLNGVDIKGMVNTFGERPAGELIALIGSTGNLGVSIVNGNAAQRLGTKIGDRVDVLLEQ